MNTKPKFTEKKFLVTLIFVATLFLLWGVAMTMGDILNKHFQNVLHVSKSDSSLLQLSIFGAYFVMGIPAGWFMKKFGYKAGVLLGLGLYATGAFLFIPAANNESFTFFRLALFILACGLATLETVAHPFVAALGDQRTSDQRMNFAQCFNGVGAVIGPQLGKLFLFSGVAFAVGDELASVKELYMGIGIVITLIAIAFAFIKIPKLTDPHAVQQANITAVNIDVKPAKSLLQHRHFMWAVVAQFFCTAAQGGTWAFFINYGHDIMGYTDATAADYFTLSMIMMMVGRFVGTYLMRFIAPNKLLAAFSLGSILMCLIVAQKLGMASMIALVMINFFFSIMFPTIFSLGLKNLGTRTQQASSFIVMGVVGGALFPRVMGLVADKDVASAYYLPIICYAIIFLFGYKFYKVKA